VSGLVDALIARADVDEAVLRCWRMEKLLIWE